MKKLWSTTVIGMDLTADVMFHFHQVSYIVQPAGLIMLIIDCRSCPSTFEDTTNVLKKKLLILEHISIVSDLGIQRTNSATYRKP